MHNILTYNYNTHTHAQIYTNTHVYISTYLHTYALPQIVSFENQIVVCACFINFFRFLHIIVELDELYRMVLVLEFNFK